MASPLRRYFEALLLLLLAAGFATLASTGRLAWPVVLAAGAAFVGRGVCFVRRIPVRLPPRWLLAGLLLYVPLYLADGWLFSGSFLIATLHVVVLTGAAKLYSLHSSRDYLSLGLLAVLEVMTAALLTVSGLFFVLFLIFLLLLVATLVAHEMCQAQQAAAEAAGDEGAALPAAAAPAAPAPRWPLLRFSLLLSLGVALASVAIFFVLPRTTLGAWSSNHPASGLSGFSDEVRLGSIASLQRTNNPVMHIRVTSADPPVDPATFQDIPWRGRGLSTFDGKRWYTPEPPTLRGTRSGLLDVNSISLRQPPRIVRYQVTLEPLSSPVLFFPATLLRAATHYHLLAWDRSTGTLASPLPDGTDAGFAGTSYSGVSNLAQPPPEQLRAESSGEARLRYDLRPFIQLPNDLDPRVRALARSITLHTPRNNWDRMQALTNYLQAHYQYSLDDLPQGSDPLATFLFDQPTGDCEYFASALAVMARTLDIPTRVVNGFVVGSYNPLSGEYLVRGGDAHSWVEAFFPAPYDSQITPEYRRADRGTWVAFDATPAAAAGGGDASSFWPGMLLDALSSFWQERFINYDWVQQTRLARHLQNNLGDVLGNAWQSGQDTLSRVSAGVTSTARPLAERYAAGLAVCLLFGGLLVRQGRFRLRRRNRGSTPEERRRRQARQAYQRFQHALARAGHARAPAQTAPELLAAVTAARPGSELAGAAAEFVSAYERARFGPAGPDASPGEARLTAEMAAPLRAVQRLCRRRTAAPAAP